MLHRDELTGALHGLLRVRMFSQDDAHIFCTPEQIEDEIFGCLDFGYAIYDRLGLEIKVELSTRPGEQARHRRGVGRRRGGARSGARAARARVRRERGRRRVLRAEDRPAHARLARPLVADRDGPARLPDAAALRASATGRRQRRAHAGDDPPRADRLVRALHRDPDRALRAARSRSGSRRCSCACSRWASAIASRRARSPRSSRRYRVEVDESDETVGKKIRNAEVEKIPFVIVYGDKESRRVARGPRARRRAVDAVACGASRDRLLR